MTKQASAKRMYPLLILAGELLVVLGFALVTENSERGPVAWLNLAICMLVFLFDTTAPLFFTRGTGEFSANLPSLGILWFLDVFYTLAALSVMIAGWQWAIEFRVQLLSQLAVLLVVSGVVVSSIHATEHAGKVAAGEREAGANLDLLREALNLLVIEISLQPALTASEALVKKCSEDLRYMTPSRKANAVELESQLLQKTHELEAFLRNRTAEMTGEDALRTGVGTRLEELLSLLRLRKACGTE